MRIEDLPFRAQQQVLKKLADQERRELEAKASKYHNQRDERATSSGPSIRFDSKKEARRFDELAVMLRAGTIQDLKLQPQFTLQEAYTTTAGVRVRAIRYQADFSYQRDGALVVEDVKSRATRTREYLIKKKLMQERLGIEIQEV